MLSRLTTALRRHGLAGTCRLLPTALAHQFDPRHRRRRASKLAFDRRYGTDTAEMVAVAAFGLPDHEARHMVHYEACDADQTLAELETLDLPWPDYDFIDYGSGKGRQVLVAAGLPFRRVVGIERVADLHHIAQRNVELFRPHLRCGALELRCGDARDYVPEPRPTVFFFYNPFDRGVLDPVMATIERACDPVLPRCVVLYANPAHAARLEDSPRWRTVRRGPFWLVAFGR